MHDNNNSNNNNNLKFLYYLAKGSKSLEDFIQLAEVNQGFKKLDSHIKGPGELFDEKLKTTL